MLSFDPPELRTRWRDALHVLNQYCEFEGFPNLLDPAHSDDAYEEWVVEPTTNVEYVVLPHAENLPILNVDELLTLADELRGAQLVDRTIAVCGSRAYVSVEATGDAEPRVLHIENSPIFDHRYTSHWGAATLALRVGLTPFAFLVAATCGEYCPSYYEKDVFVELTFESGRPSPEEILKAVRAYLFELSCARVGSFRVERFRTNFDETLDPELAIDFTRAPEEHGEEWERWYSGETERVEAIERQREAELRGTRLRPLISGPGVDDLIKLHLKAVSFQGVDTEYQVLCFAKVIEYVSMTVVRQAAHHEVRKRLRDRRALAPDAEFIEGLLALVEGHVSNRTRDAESLRLAVGEVCDLVLLRPFAPKFMRRLCSIANDKLGVEREEIVAELASSITATRNEIAHGKANFIPSGAECPAEQLDAFAALMRLVSEQAIGWFAQVPNDMRVVRVGSLPKGRR